VKEGFLKEYLEVDQEEPKGAVALRDQVHEIPIHGAKHHLERIF